MELTVWVLFGAWWAAMLVFSLRHPRGPRTMTSDEFAAVDRAIEREAAEAVEYDAWIAERRDGAR